MKEMRSIIQVNPFHVDTCCLNNGARQIVYYPKVMFHENCRWENHMNQAINEQVIALISEQVGNVPSTVDEMLGLYELKNNQRQVLSLSLSNYTYHKQAAHGMTYIQSLTFDFEKEKICQLNDLFTAGANYVQRISELIEAQIIQRDIPLLGEFTGIRPDQDFYIADKALVIYFQLYEITPYVVGLPMFPISVFDLTDLFDDQSPLSRMAVNN